MWKIIMRGLASALIGVSTMGVAEGAQGPAEADALVRRISAEVIDTARTDQDIKANDPTAILALVEDKLMPHLDFESITRSAVGPAWRGATFEQRSRLQAEFKTLLIRVYSGALSQVRDHRVAIVRSVPVAGGAQQVVQTEVRGKGEPVKLDYRLDRQPGAADWKIVDVGIAGLWLVQSYRSQFAPVLARGGPDGLVTALAQRNAPREKR